MESSKLLGTIIGIGQMHVTSDPTELMTAPNLGSCVGVAVIDRASHVGGMIHCLLPLSTKNPERANKEPATFVDTGIPLLLEKIFEKGGQKKNLEIYVAGGASINSTNDVFEIGSKNYTVLRKVLWKNNLLINAEHVGADTPRSLSLSMDDGVVCVKVKGEKIQLSK